ncbi:MAG TPA: tetratricopeptide repeat protein [Spirochaetota bacterium]|nr:tetratricopeptide repeat protein [Spirochaetota bacterium]
MKKIAIILLVTCLALPLAANGPRDMVILVHPFANAGDSRYAWLSAGMADSVMSDLLLVKNIRVISERDRKKGLQEIEFSMSGMVDEQKAVKAGSMLGANVIFTGSYTVINNSVRVIAKLIDVKTGEMVKTAKLDGSLDNIFQLQDRIVITLLAEAQKAEIRDIRPPVISDQDKRAISDAPKTTFSAYEWYSKGLNIRYTNPRQALEFFEKAIAIDRNYGDALEQAGYIAGVNFSQFDRGLEYLNRAEAAFRSHPGANTEKYAGVMISIASIHWNRQDLDRSLNYYFRARDTYSNLGKRLSFGYASSVWGIGLIYYGKRQLAEALRWYQESKEVYDSLGMQNTSSYADLLTNFGSAYYSMYRHNEAFDYYSRSKRILDDLQLQNTTAYANAVWGLGLILYERRDYDQALEHYTVAERSFINLGMRNSATYATFIMNIALVYEKQNRFDEALDYYGRCRSIYDALGLRNTLNYGNLLMNIGVVHQRRNNLDQALRHFTESRDVLARLNVRESQSYANALYNIGTVHDRQGRRGEAARFYREAAGIYERIGSAEWRDRALNRAGELER